MRNVVASVRKSPGRLARVADAGVTSIEYAILASLIAVVIVGAVGLLGTHVGSFYSQIAGGL